MANQELKPPAVFGAICAVSADIAKKGVSKDRKNEQQGFKFRGIDDVMNALSSSLSANGLCILPEALERNENEVITKSGCVLRFVVVKVKFSIIAAADGSQHDVIMYGEAMDSGDKATNKAMSAAYKYMALQVFCIPTIGDDADSVTHEIVKPPAIKPPKQPNAPTAQIDIASIDLALIACDTVDAIGSYYKSIGSPKDTAIIERFAARKAQLNEIKG
jgi:hypothetical protein